MKRNLTVASAVFLLVLCVLLFVEDLLIWVEQGTVPGIEFFIFAVVAFTAVYLGFRPARLHRP